MSDQEREEKLRRAKEMASEFCSSAANMKSSSSLEKLKLNPS
jgi:hypothetical protein